MSSLGNRIRSIKQRLQPAHGPEQLERARKRAAAEAQRRAYQRDDMQSKIHRR